MFVMVFAACGDNPTSTTNSEANTEAAVTEGLNEWEQFLVDYEAWVDEYIEVVKKYKENPTDATILTEYSTMVNELSDWTERAENLETELTDEEIVEYSEKLADITNKLSEVVD